MRRGGPPTAAPLAPGDTGVVCDAGASDASMTYPFGRGQTASG